MKTCKELAIKEGIFSGTSGGGTLRAALDLAKDCPKGTSILALIADTGERYLSTPLFEDIPADMTEEEKAIADSTPSTPPPAPGLPAVVPEATEWVKGKIGEQKIVCFMLKYCEFCWTLTSFLDTLGVDYLRIDVDSFEYAQDNMGNKYRSALQELTDCKTFPQLFINGEYIGGAVDACMMWKKDELQPKLKEAGIEYSDYEGDPVRLSFTLHVGHNGYTMEMEQQCMLESNCNHKRTTHIYLFLDPLISLFLLSSYLTTF
jgi:cysteine synthase